MLIIFFEAFITIMFLYQCGIWTLTEILNNNIDVFKRMFMTRIMGIYMISNENYKIYKELYKITNQGPWSEKCRYHRLTLFGHTRHLPTSAPLKEQLQKVLRPVLNLPGGQKVP